MLLFLHLPLRFIQKVPFPAITQVQFVGEKTFGKLSNTIRASGFIQGLLVALVALGSDQCWSSHAWHKRQCQVGHQIHQ